MRFSPCALAMAAALAWEAEGSFDVAPIKPAKPDAGVLDPPGAQADNVTLKLLSGGAHHVYDFQTSGGATWIDSEWHNLEAMAGEAVPAGRELRGMLQTLLTDRFGLQVRRRSRDMRVFVPTKRRGGSRMQFSKVKDATKVFRVQQ